MLILLPTVMKVEKQSRSITKKSKHTCLQNKHESKILPTVEVKAARRCADETGSEILGGR